MILAVDIGNSRATLGVFDDETLVRSFSLPSAQLGDPSSEPADSLLDFDHVSDIVIASVVPSVTAIAADHLRTAMPAAHLSILDNSSVPIINRYRHPEQVGIDRLLGSLAAYRLYAADEQRPTIVIDLGTATTFDCVNASGEYLGGIISLGIESSADHLSSIAAQLPKIELEFPTRVLGRSTLESMQSGILFGAVDAIEGLIRRLRSEVFANEVPMIVATGGLSRLIAAHMSVIDHLDPALVLRGIDLTLASL
jgi:type III pantothenate kinase